MLIGWMALASASALAVVTPIHLGLWLPLADRRLHWESGPARLSFRTAGWMFVATIGLHLLWTLLSSAALMPAAGTMIGLIAANVILAPFLFVASYGIWLHWRILRQPDRQPWLWLAEAPPEPEDALPSVTAVIACRNEPFEVVQMALRSVFSLKYPERKLSFIIADNSDEDHPGFLALRREVEARQCRGEPIELLHRRGTRGFKAGNLDMTLQVACGYLLLILDADSTVHESLLLAHASRLWRNHDVAYLQCFQLVSNGHISLVAATATSVVGYHKYHDLSLAAFTGWSFSRDMPASGSARPF